MHQSVDLGECTLLVTFCSEKTAYTNQCITQSILSIKSKGCTVIFKECFYRCYHIYIHLQTLGVPFSYKQANMIDTSVVGEAFSYVCVSSSVLSVFLKPHGLATNLATRQDYQSGLPFPSSGNLPDPQIEPGYPELQADSLLSETPGKWQLCEY